MEYLSVLLKRKKLLIGIGIIMAIFFGSIISCYKNAVPTRNSASPWKPDLHFLENKDRQPVNVGFVCRQSEPDDTEVCRMVDEVIYQVFGEKGLKAIIKPGDKVVIKINLATMVHGAHGDKGRGCITDPRVVRYLAEKIRDIIGWKEPASIIVADSLFHEDPHPDIKKGWNSFFLARIERHGYDPYDRVDPKDFCYDFNDDCILDGTSGAKLVNLDSIGMDRRFLTVVQEPTLGETRVYLPNILRTKEQANGSQEYCDVLIGLPTFKSHVMAGLTGALKLHYGFRHNLPVGDETGRFEHSGFYQMHNENYIFDYLCAQHKVRTYDFVIMDAITGNRRGPHNVRFQNTYQYYPGINNPVDYILVNALLASTDPVAVDTVTSLLAGYKPDSIPLIWSAALNGLGVCWPEWIRLAGQDAFNKHRLYLMDIYNPDKMREKYEGKIAPDLYNWDGSEMIPWNAGNKIGVYGSYPFPEWGPARNIENYEYKAFNSTSLQVSKADNNRYQLKYSISSEGRKDNDVARVDFLINGTLIGFNVKSKWEDVYEADLSGYHGNVTCRLAAWDYRLNCTLSEAVMMNLP